LIVGNAADDYESEAHQFAARILEMPCPRNDSLPSCAGPIADKTVLRAPRGSRADTAGTGVEAPRAVTNVVNSPGAPLAAATRDFMEPRFGHDFSDVRVHTDPPAAESATSVKASAYTVGRHIVFGAGQYAPNTAGGRVLLAHELTHVVQQRLGARPVVQRTPNLRQGELGEHIVSQFLDDEGMIVFNDWGKEASANGFDKLAYDIKRKRLWCIDNKAQGATISEVSSLSTGTFETNLTRAKAMLNKQAGAEAKAALDAIARFEAGEASAVVKVVSNAYSAGRAGFSEALFANGIQAFDVRLGRLFGSRAVWLEALRAAGLMRGVRRYARPGQRNLGRQRGFASIGGIVFALVASGATLYAMSQAKDKLDAAAELATGIAIDGVVAKLAGGGIVGIIVTSTLSLCSDDAQMQKECERREVAIKFLGKVMPGAVKTHGWGITWQEVDQEALDDAYDFLFNTDPIVVKDQAPVKTPAPAPAGTASVPSPPVPARQP